MRKRLLPAALCAGAALIAARAAQPQAAAPSFNVFVGVGDSLAAGVSNSSLVETHQRNSVPALVARQAAVADFQQPLVAEPGIPPELVLVSLTPPVIAPRSTTSGAPINSGLARAYNNLAVPGATVVDFVNRTTDAGGFHDLVLRGRGTALAQALSLQPTFVLIWLGNNDVLGAVIAGRAVSGETLTPPDAFRTAYEQAVAALRTTSARFVAANIPDVTTVPFATTIPPVVVNPATGQPVLVDGAPVPLLSQRGPLPPGTLVTLAAASLIAQGIGVPTSVGGQGTPLPGEVILDAGELAIIEDHIRLNNETITRVCQGANIPVLDVNALVREIATTGRNVGGVRVTASYLTGGAFGLDGIHPSDLGYALLANDFIGVINRSGAQLEPVSLAPYLGVGAARDPDARVPWFEFTLDAYERLLDAFPPVNRE